MLNKTERQKEQILRMSGVNPKKCMRCGKCPEHVLLTTRWNTIRTSLFTWWKTAIWKR